MTTQGVVDRTGVLPFLLSTSYLTNANILCQELLGSNLYLFIQTNTQRRVRWFEPDSHWSCVSVIWCDSYSERITLSFLSRSLRRNEHTLELLQMSKVR